MRLHLLIWSLNLEYKPCWDRNQPDIYFEYPTVWEISATWWILNSWPGGRHCLWGKAMYLFLLGFWLEWSLYSFKEILEYWLCHSWEVLRTVLLLQPLGHLSVYFLPTLWSLSAKEYCLHCWSCCSRGHVGLSIEWKSCAPTMTQST